MGGSEEPPYVAPPLVVPGRVRTLAYNAALPMISETVDAEGHLIDSGDLQAILTTIVEQGASYEILNFDMGRTNASPSRLSLRLSTATRESLDHLLATLTTFGCYVQGAPDAVVRVNDIDGAAPDDFYSTTNHRTQVLIGGQWRRSSGSGWTPPSSSTPTGSSAASCAT